MAEALEEWVCSLKKSGVPVFPLQRSKRTCTSYYGQTEVLQPLLVSGRGLKKIERAVSSRCVILKAGYLMWDMVAVPAYGGCISLDGWE